MLSVLLLLTNMASAEIVCTPASAKGNDKNMIVCGDENITTYSAKNQKVDSVTIIFKDDTRGVEKSVTFKTPGLSIEQINSGNATKSAMVKKEIEKIKKGWNLKEVKWDVSNFEVGTKTSLYTTADLKTKTSLDKIKKVNRNVASDGAPIAGGVRRASGEK